MQIVQIVARGVCINTLAFAGAEISPDGKSIFIDGGIWPVEDGAIAMQQDGAGIGWRVQGDKLVPPDNPPVLMAEQRYVTEQRLRAACDSAVIGGFESDALGAPHTYPSKVVDQINLMGSTTASLLPGLPDDWTTPFWCADADGDWQMRQHSAEQIQLVGLAGKAHVLMCQTHLDELTRQVALATDAAELATIEWGL